MNETQIFYPIFAHVLLVIALYVILALRKISAVKAGVVDRKATAINSNAWSDDVIKVSNNLANQFESPVIFYVLCVIAFQLGVVNDWLVGLAWLYVALRGVHSYIHINANKVPIRMPVFVLSLLVILTMMVQIAGKIS